MKSGRTYSKMMIRGVRGTASRFLAILCIVALGTGFLCGLLSTEPDMKTGADRYFDEQNAMDYLLQSTVGFSEEDIEALRGEPYIAQADGKHQMDMLIKDTGDESYVTRVIGEDFGDEGAVSRVQILEGRLPENEGECAIELPNRYAYDMQVGEKLAVDPQNRDLDSIEESLSRTSFEVVGLVRTPQFIHMQGDSSTVGDGTMVMAMYVPDSVYTLDYYTAVYATAEGAKELDTFTEEYRDLIEAQEEELTAFGKIRAQERTATLKEEAQDAYDEAVGEFETEKKKAEDELQSAADQIADGERQLDDARSQIASGRAQIEDGRRQIEDGRKAINDARAELDDGEQQLQDAAAQIEDGKRQLADGRTLLTAAQAELAEQDAALKEQESLLAANADAVEQLRAAGESGMPLTAEQEAMIAQYDAGVAAAAAGRQQIDAAAAELAANEAKLTEQEQQAAAGLQELDAKAAQIADARQQLDEQEKILDETAQQLDQNEAQLNTNEQTLAEKENDLLQAKQDYEDGKKEAEEQFAEAEEELKDAQREIDKIENGKWIIRDRADNFGISSYDDDSAKIGAIAKVFPVFFFIIAALVALTTLTRMVEEERGRIGALKSLGYTNGAILRYYLLYGFVASVAGCLIGIPLGCIFFPKVISNAYRMMYVLPPIEMPILLPVALSVAGGLTLMILLATWLACRGMLLEKPAALLQPKAPKVGKRILLERIGFLWRPLRFSYKVTMRNIFRYKKRFLMTIVGVAGCFALLLAGFGIRDSIGHIVDLQYGEVMHYDYSAVVDAREDLDEDPAIVDTLADKSLVAGWCACCEAPVTVSANGKKEDSTFCVPEDPRDFTKYVTLRERAGHANIPYGEGSVVLTEKSAENLGVKRGDTVTLTAEDGTTAEAVLTGVTENYVSSYVYMYTDDYEAAFDAAPDYTTVFVRAGASGGGGKTAESLLESDRILYVVDTDVVRANFEESVKSIDYIVMVLIAASGALAVIVLYNLTNVNICERRKELATIRVLGFYRQEVSAYIFREVNILAALGILIGIPVGVWLHRFIVITVEVNNVMFGRTIDWPSYLIAAGLTVAFTLLVNFIMRPQIRKIDMVESMKAVD